jgi:hypothetical protein
MPKKLTKIELQKRLDRAAVARVRRLIELHPEMFDYGDIPPCRPLNPIQEAKMDALAPDWVKRFKKNTAYLRQLEAENQIVIDAFKANFKAANSWRSF